MYGFVRYSKGEMKVKEYESYKAIYCSLCKCLGKNYGVLTRFTLSYDFTFLSILCLALTQDCPSFKAGRCTFNPLKKCNYCQNGDYLMLPAAASVITFYYKLCDNVADNKGIKKLLYKAAKGIFSKKHKKAAALYPQIEDTLARYIKNQRLLEKNKETLIDKAADPSANMLADIFCALSKDETQKRVLSRFGYCIGRYVYLLDAASDFNKDKKSGNYNVLLLNCKTKEEAAEKIKPQLYASVNEAQKAFELIDLKRYKTILANVVYLGLEDTFLKELKNEKSV